MGQEAHMMPTLPSAADNSAVVVKVHVGSLRERSELTTTRRILIAVALSAG